MPQQRTPGPRGLGRAGDVERHDVRRPICALQSAADAAHTRQQPPAQRKARQCSVLGMLGEPSSVYNDLNLVSHARRVCCAWATYEGETSCEDERQGRPHCEVLERRERCDHEYKLLISVRELCVHVGMRKGSVVRSASLSP